MTTYVPRHEFPHGIDPELLTFENQYRNKLVQKMERDCSHIDLYLDPVYGAVETALRMDPEAAAVETWESWTIAMQVYNAVFTLYEAEKGTEVEYLIGHKMRTLTASGKLYCADAAT